MNTKKLLSLTAAALCLAAPLPAAVPQAINYQGQVKVNDIPFTGNGQFKFVIVDAAPGGGASLWSNDGTSVNGSAPTAYVPLGVTNGLFSVGLGDFAHHTNMWPITPATFTTHPNTVLRVWFNDGVQGWQQLSPDTLLASVPYAMSAHVPDGSITGSLLAQNTIDPSRLAIAGTAATGRLLSYNGTGFSWADLSVVNTNWIRSGNTVYYNAGNVGIGTAATAHRLGIAGGPFWTGSTWLGALGLENAAAIGWAANAGGQRFGMGHSSGGFYMFRTTSDLGDPWSPALYDFTISDAGYVGINTTAPTSPLHVHWPSWNATAVPNISMSGENSALQWSSSPVALPGREYRWLALHGASGGLEFWHRSINSSTIPVQDSGWVKKATLGSDGSFDLAGSASVCSLTIRGGCDLAEPFPMKEEGVEKGSVVVIDDEHPGRLKCSTRAYDTRVAGIISGANGINPGIALHQEGTLDQGQNVALTGRVYVRADAASGRINPGDLLTTSDTPGHAMKVADHAKAQGAILGKAMTGLSAGKGMVLVLVTLQ